METKDLFIRQLSVIIENKKGAFADWALLLSENNIDLIAAAIADIGERGTLRAIVSDPQRAYELLCEKRYAVSLTDVIAVPLLDHPGALAELLDLLRDHNISIEYLYSFLRRLEGDGVVALRANLPGAAVKVLLESGISPLREDQLKKKQKWRMRKHPPLCRDGMKGEGYVKSKAGELRAEFPAGRQIAVPWGVIYRQPSLPIE